MRRPGWEAGVGQFQAVGRIASIEGYRSFQVRRRAARDQVLERQGIDFEACAIKADRLTVHSQDLILHWPQRFSENGQSLAQAGLSLLITFVAPQ